MNSRERARYKKLLETKQEELAAGFNAARSRGFQGSDDGDKDYIDYAVSSYTKEFLLSLSDMERQQLRRVQTALRAIGDGSYGDCVECHETIEDKRLKAVPEAPYCLACQELADRGLLGAGEDDDE